MSLLTDTIAQFPVEQRLPATLQMLESVLRVLPVDELRSLVAKGESVMGKGNPPLPSGQPFDKATRRGRLYLDLIDDLKQLEEEYR